jgi:two-component system, NarL family, response regulator LiaR
METSIRVGIVDSHDRVRESLKLFLDITDDLIFVGEASSEVETFLMCEEAKPDVILLDFLQQEDQGLVMIERLLKGFPKLLIIILTALMDTQRVSRTVQAGVVGYLLKQVSIDTLADAIRSAYNGGFTFNEEVEKDVMVSFSPPYIESFPPLLRQVSAKVELTF